MDMWGRIQVFFKECMEEQDYDQKNREREEYLGKHGEPRLGTSKHFLQLKTKSI